VTARSEASPRGGNRQGERLLRLSVLTGDFENRGWPTFTCLRFDTQPLLPKQRDGSFTERRVEAGSPITKTGSSRPAWAVRRRTTTATGGSTSSRPTSTATSRTSTQRGRRDFQLRTFDAKLGFYLKISELGRRLLRLRQRRLADIFHRQRHVYPEPESHQIPSRLSATQSLYHNAERPVRRRHLDLGPGLELRRPDRRAFGDFDNDGWLDVLITIRTTRPRSCTARAPTRTTGSRFARGAKSNPTDRGARHVEAGGRRQMQRWTSGASYLSQNDLRLHFGSASDDDRSARDRWPSGTVDKIEERIGRPCRGERGGQGRAQSK